VAFSALAKCISASAVSVPVHLGVLPAEVVEQHAMAFQEIAIRGLQPVALRTCTPTSSAWESGGHACASTDELISPGAPVRATTTRSRVSHGSTMPCRSRVSPRVLVDPVGDPQQRQLTQRTQVAGTEVVTECGVDLLRGVDVPVGHAAPATASGVMSTSSIWSAGSHHRIGNGLALGHPGDPLDGRRSATPDAGCSPWR